MATLKQLETEDLGRTYRKMLSFEYKRAEDKSSDPDVAGEIEGYAAGLLNIDKGDDLIFPGFFRDVTKEDVVVAYQHDITSILGRPLTLEEKYAPDFGLWTVSEIVATTLGTDVMKLVRRKILKKMSIGYRLKSGGYSMLNRDSLIGTLKDFEYNGQGIPEDKQTEIIAEFDRRKLEACFGLFRGDLREYSIVTFPMNDRASITGAKDEEGESPLDGLPFSQHPALVLATNKGYITRARQLFEKRSADNRGLGAAHIEALEIIAGEGLKVSQEARALLAEMGKQSTGAMSKAEEERLVAHAQDLMAEIDARMSGALPPGTTY